MAKYRITAPDGHDYEIEGPEGATDDQVRAAVLAQHPAAAAAASAQAQSYDGGSEMAPPANDAAPVAPAQPVRAPAIANAPQYSGPAAVGGSATETQYGDGAGKSGPNMRMSPADEAEITRILANDPIDTAREHAIAYREARYPHMFSPNDFGDVIAYRRKTGTVSGEIAYGKPAPIDTGGNESADAAALGVASDVPGINKIEAVANTAEKWVRGDLNGGFGDNYQRQLDRIEATNEQAQSDHPYFYGGGQLAGLLAIPTDAPAVASRAALEAGTAALKSGETMLVARKAAQKAYRIASGNRTAVELAAYGGAKGAGDADNIPDAITGGVTDAVSGLVGGKVMGDLAPRIFHSTVDAAARNALTPGQDVMAAADRLGIDPLPADVGGAATRRATSATSQTMIGGKPIIDASTRMVDQAQAARDKIAADIGTVLRPEAAGETARSGAQSYIATTRGQKNTLYTLAEKAAGDTRVAPTKALEVLDRNIAELGENPAGAPALARLQGLRDALAKGDVSVSGMKNMRTALREQFMQDGLRGSDTERRVLQVMDAADEDVTNGLASVGKGGAATAYKRAAAFARDRIQTIDNVLTPIIGKDGTKSGEQIVKSLMGDLQGNNARAVKFLKTLPDAEAGDVRASVIGGLGRATKGTQNAEGDGFSLGTFLTNYNEIGESAKAAYFGLEGRAALNDLAKVADGAKEAAKYANRSNTAGGVANIATGATGLLGLPVLAKVLIGQYAAGRLLASPRVARWLAKSGKTTLSPQAYVERLGRIARAEPQLANDIFGLQRKLTDAFSGGAPLRAAADQDTQEPGIVNGNAGQDQSQYEGAQP